MTFGLTLTMKVKVRVWILKHNIIGLSENTTIPKGGVDFSPYGLHSEKVQRFYTKYDDSEWL